MGATSFPSSAIIGGLPSGSGATILFDALLGRIYNAAAPSSATEVTLDFTGAVAGASAMFVSDGSEVSISSENTVYLGSQQKTGSQGTLFLLWDGSSVYASWVPGVPTQLGTPSVSLAAGNASADYSISGEDTAATGGVFEISTDAGSTWAAVSGYSFATKTGTISGLSNGVTVQVRLKSTASGYTDSDYATASTTPFAPVANTKSGSFNGTTSRVTSDANIASIHIGNSGSSADKPFSLSMWMKPDATAGTQPLVQYGVAGGDQMWGLIKQGTGSGTPDVLSFVINQVHFSILINITSSFTVPAGADWVHILATYDGSAHQNGMKLYKNGVLDSSPTKTQTGTYTRAGYSTSARLNLGYRQIPEATNFADGLYDEVAIWDMLLDDADAVRIYNSGVPIDLSDDGNQANLQLWTRFEDSVADLSQNSSAFTPTDLTYSTDRPQ